MTTLTPNSEHLELTDFVYRKYRKVGDHETQIPGVTVHLRNSPTEPLHCVYTLSLALVLQGSKELLLDGDIRQCCAGQTMLTTFDLPVISHVTEASRTSPFIAVILKLDYGLILECCEELKLPQPAKDIRYQSLSCHDVEPGMLHTVKRLFETQNEPTLKVGLMPLIQKEIVFRLLDGPHGLHLRHLAAEGSPNSRVVSAISWLKHNFMKQIGMDTLAEKAHMSPSTFRQHFKSLTGNSPLQYLKTLRLQEARDQMVANGLDASLASSMVGYESASQFSREYSRLFGVSPQKDIKRLRDGQ